MKTSHIYPKRCFFHKLFSRNLRAHVCPRSMILLRVEHFHMMDYHFDWLLYSRVVQTSCYYNFFSLLLLYLVGFGFMSFGHGYVLVSYFSQSSCNSYRIKAQRGEENFVKRKIPQSHHSAANDDKHEWKTNNKCPN